MKASHTVTRYTVNTEHHTDAGIVRKTTTFDDFDVAFAFASATGPMIDGSMMPNVSDELANHPRYERGVFDGPNRYAVITSEPARS